MAYSIARSSKILCLILLLIPGVTQIVHADEDSNSDRMLKIFGVIEHAHDHFDRKKVSAQDIKRYMESQVGPAASFSTDGDYIYLIYAPNKVDDYMSETISCKLWYANIQGKNFFGQDYTSDPFLTGSCNSTTEKISDRNGKPLKVKHR